MGLFRYLYNSMWPVIWLGAVCIYLSNHIHYVIVDQSTATCVYWKYSIREVKPTTGEGEHYICFETTPQSLHYFTHASYVSSTSSDILYFLDSTNIPAEWPEWMSSLPDLL